LCRGRQYGLPECNLLERSHPLTQAPRGMPGRRAVPGPGNHPPALRIRMRTSNPVPWRRCAWPGSTYRTGFRVRAHPAVSVACASPTSGAYLVAAASRSPPRPIKHPY
jgi:hypothetical protein